MDSLFGKVVVYLALVAVEDGRFFIRTAAIHRLLASVLEQAQNLGFLRFIHVGIFDEITLVGELNFPIRHLVFHLLDLLRGQIGGELGQKFVVKLFQ